MITTHLAELSSLDKAIRQYGSRMAFSAKLNLTPQAVAKWQKGRIPAERVSEIVSITDGIVPHDLRPDIFPALSLSPISEHFKE